MMPGRSSRWLSQSCHQLQAPRFKSESECVRVHQHRVVSDENISVFLLLHRERGAPAGPEFATMLAHSARSRIPVRGPRGNSCKPRIGAPSGRVLLAQTQGTRS